MRARTHRLEQAPWRLAELPAVAPATAAYWAALAGITLLAAWLRVEHLMHPMRYDESFSLLMFAAPDDPGRWFHYLAPNNHVLHTLAVHLSVSRFGLLPPAVRLPALLAGVLLVPSAASLARRVSGSAVAGLIVAALTGASSLLVEYSVNARGYAMVCLAGVWMARFTADLFRDARRIGPWIGWILAGAAGAFTIPIMVYPAGILLLALAAQLGLCRADRAVRRKIALRLVVAVAATAALTALAYLPVIEVSGLEALVANRFVSPQPLGEVAAALPGVAGQTLRDWFRDGSWAWAALVGAGVVGSLVEAVRRRAVLWALPALAAVLLPAAALAQRVVPFPRVWLFALPWTLALSACGAMVLVRLLPRPAPRTVGKIAGAALLAGAVGASAWNVHARKLMISEDPRTLIAAEQIARDASNALCDGRTAMLAWVPGWPSLAYYNLLYNPQRR
ncbi:MAG TPA: hypothetical protein PK082_09370, partial [Phycisphaerae bacterium]|nr:hypothetical protein [Phycisphaerae bacterium]